MKKLLIFASLLYTCLGFSSKYFQSATPEGQEPVCGYDSCHPLNPDAEYHIHLVPHSHDDVGWLKTVDQYYFGAKSFVQRAGVQYIIDSVIKELALDPNKRYIQVETAFFWRWWIEQDDETKNMVKQMVNEGRLEFIGGGWAMHDEATVHYSSLIDNMAFGMKQLHDWFGNCSAPRVGWQIDPFGHSKENARLFNWFGFDGLFFARNDYRDKGQRMKNKTLDMIWNAGETLQGSNAELYTEVQIHHYEAPPGYCFDLLCQDDPIMDNPDLHDYNKDLLIENFIKIAREDFAFFKEGPANKHLIYAMGSDFQYQNANQNYKNLDKLIKYVNELTNQTGIEALYSTPSCYMKGIYEDYVNSYPDYEWSTKDDDFFPYASAEHAYWTGYFTSRPSLKLMERRHNNLLQAAKQVQALYGHGDIGKAQIYANQSNIFTLKRAMATMQHHDAVTGTEKQNVADDYAKSLSEGAKAVLSFMGPSLYYEAGIPDLGDGVSDFLCPLTNVSQCHWTEGSDNLAILVYNPLDRPVSKVVKFPVLNANVQVFDGAGNEMPMEFIPIPEFILNVPGRESEAAFDAIFVARDIPPLGYKSFYLNRADDIFTDKILSVVKVGDPLGHDIFTGIAYYNGSGEEPQPSGAYVFRPDVQEKDFADIQDLYEVKGNLVQEYWAVMDNNWTSFIQRQYAGEDHHEVEWLVGPIPEMGAGTEVVMVYFAPPGSDANVQEDKQVFWTDSNGRQMVRRVQDTRFSYDLENGPIEEPVSSNYYPINSAIKAEMPTVNQVWTVLTDRSQGATKITPDEIEVMVHRRLFKDDHFGVDEALDEHAFGVPLVARGIHYVYRFAQDNPVWRRLKSQELYMGPLVLYQPTRITLEEWINNESGSKDYSALAKAGVLPEVINLMTVESWNSPDAKPEDETRDILLRFEHLIEASEGGETKNIEIPEDFFKDLTIVDMVEMSLGGDRPIAQVTDHKLKWTKTFMNDHPFHSLSMKTSKSGSKSFTFTMDPMAIRTFKVTVM